MYRGFRSGSVYRWRLDVITPDTKICGVMSREVVGKVFQFHCLFWYSPPTPLSPIQFQSKA
jgi:hypothetical protein